MEVAFNEFSLGKNVVGEAKNWEVERRSTLDWIYRNKFRFIDNSGISRPQLRTFFKSRSFDKVLFCLATTDDVFEYAQSKYGIKVMSAGFMIKQMIKFFRSSDHNFTYYPEWYNYNMLKTVMQYLYTMNWRDKLTLEELVCIDPRTDSRYRNHFMKTNSKFITDLISKETEGGAFEILLRRIPDDWDRKWVKDVLKSNKGLWSYLTNGA